MKSPRHEEALRYAADGIPVFPCRVNGKEPACAHGHKDATTDENQINAWWQEADYNLALCPEDAGWAVVDVDGPSGLENWNHLTDEHGNGRTASVQTPRGGRHFYFSGSVPASTGRLAEKIDTRGRGSYVLVPPSSVDGSFYQWVGDADTAPLPAWINDSLATSANAVTAPAVDELDLPANIARATARLNELVARGDVAIEGQGGDNRTYKLATEMMELGLTPETTLDLMYNIWNSHCSPVWTRDELGAKIENASRYMQNAPGVFAVQSAQEAFGSTLDKFKAETDEQTAPQNAYVILTGQEIKQVPEATWLVPDLIPELGIGMWYGDEGSYKTSLALELAFGLAHGLEIFGQKREPMDVLYLSGEGQENLAHKRLPALEVAYDVQAGAHFHFMAEMPPIYDAAEAAKIVAAIKAKNIAPKLIILDTMADAMSGLDENDLKEMRRFIDTLKGIKKAFKCATLSLHHTNKDNKYRGSTGLKALDFRGRVTAWDATKAVAIKIEKMRDAEKRAEPWTFQGQKVGQGLVFRPTTLKEHAELIRTESAFEGKKVGAALEQLRAIGQANAVKTRVLADKLIPMSNSSVEEREAELDAACKSLNLLARTTLMAYCDGPKTDRVWFLPEQADRT